MEYSQRWKKSELYVSDKCLNPYSNGLLSEKVDKIVKVSDITS